MQTPAEDHWAALPAELKQRRQWIVWRYEARRGREKPGKAPYQPGNGHRARTDAPVTWGSFAQAHARYAHGGYDGLGFVFSADDPYCGIDLDGCRDVETGQIGAWAERFIHSLDSYTELSPSGAGVHILVRAELPLHRGFKQTQVEVYDSERYFTVTGYHLAGTPTTIEERQAEVLALFRAYAPQAQKSKERRQEMRWRPAQSQDDATVLAKAFGAANAATFRALWNGELISHTSKSEADFTLCLLLAYWTNGDAQQIDRLFRQSGLMSDKWDRKLGAFTYGEVTIYQALQKGRPLGVPTKRERGDACKQG